MIRLAGRVVAALLACSSATAYAQSDPAQDAEPPAGGWEFIVAPYLLAPALDGDVTIRGRDAEVGISQGDIFSNLNFGFMGYFEAKHDGQWGIAADAIFSSLDVTDDASVVEVDMTQGIYTVAALLQVAPAVELYGGGRLVVLDTTAQFDGPLAPAIVEQGRSWVDPLVGARVSVPLADRWNFVAAADIGGFGVGSDLSVNIWPAVTYQVSSAIRGAAGYRALYIDYDDGTGTSRFAYDVWMHGPLLGLIAKF